MRRINQRSTRNGNRGTGRRKSRIRSDLRSVQPRADRRSISVLRAPERRASRLLQRADGFLCVVSVRRHLPRPPQAADLFVGARPHAYQGRDQPARHSADLHHDGPAGPHAASSPDHQSVHARYGERARADHQAVRDRPRRSDEDEGRGRRRGGPDQIHRVASAHDGRRGHSRRASGGPREVRPLVGRDHLGLRRLSPSTSSRRSARSRAWSRTLAACAKRGAPTRRAT